jgi:hypothetical protein
VNKYVAEGSKVEFFHLFQAANGAFDQLRMADILAAHLTSISCAKVARAAAGGERYVSPRGDGEAAHRRAADGPAGGERAEAVLSAFEYMTVESKST